MKKKFHKVHFLITHLIRAILWSISSILLHIYNTNNIVLMFVGLKMRKISIKLVFILLYFHIIVLLLLALLNWIFDSFPSFISHFTAQTLIMKIAFLSHFSFICLIRVLNEHSMQWQNYHIGKVKLFQIEYLFILKMRFL